MQSSNVIEIANRLYDNGLVIGLILFIIAQQGFYMWMIHKFTNKLMSRDFHSYNHVVNPPKPINFRVDIPDDGYDPIKELNTKFSL